MLLKEEIFAVEDAGPTGGGDGNIDGGGGYCYADGYCSGGDAIKVVRGDI